MTIRMCICVEKHIWVIVASYHFDSFVLSILSDWNDMTTQNETQQSGRKVLLTCYYQDSHEENETFLCKGENPFNCKELITTRQNVAEGKFSTRDNSRKKNFYVYINDPSTADSGTYWNYCGSDRTRQPANYTKIHLSVGEYTGYSYLIFYNTNVFHYFCICAPFVISSTTSVLILKQKGWSCENYLAQWCITAVFVPYLMPLNN